MRFRLTLDVADRLPALLPANYQYPISAWIYKTIHEGDHAFANFLHNTGFRTGSAAYKFFTFSNLRFPQQGFEMVADRMKLRKSNIAIEISFLAPEAMRHFIGGLFSNQQVRIGDKKSAVAFKVAQVEALPMPEFKPIMHYSCMSPVVISSKDDTARYARYLSPTDTVYEELFLNNLHHKAISAISHGLVDRFSLDDMESHFRLRSEKAFSKLITIKAGTMAESKIRGYLYDFELKAPLLWHHIGYLSGFGEKNSLGMGCGESAPTILTQ